MAGTRPPCCPIMTLLSAARDGRIDAVTLLSCYALLLMAIPSSLVVGSFGAAGAPAALLAIAILCWYLVARQHSGLGLDRGRQPVRVAATIFAGVVVAAYISASRHAVPAIASRAAPTAASSC
jgi:hypothetical protein